MNYTVIVVEEISGEVKQNIVVTSDSCNNGLCSTLLNQMPSGQSCWVNVSANNKFGSSSAVTSNLTTAADIIETGKH